MIRLALVALLLLSACGVDGPPVPPSQAERDPPRTTIVIGGSVGLGVGGRL